MKVLQYPLTQITIFFVFGIVFDRYFDLESKAGIAFVIFSFILFVIAFFANRNKTPRFFFTLSTLLLSFAIGNFSAVLHDKNNDQHHYINAEKTVDDSVFLKVVLIERWKSTVKNDRFVAEVYQLNNAQASGKILLNFRKETTSATMFIGMKLMIHSKILQLQKPFNPDQFDYSSFLKNKSIYAQLYTDDSSILETNDLEKSIYYYSAIFRNRVIENLRKSGFNQKELGVVHALILGQRQDLDPEVLQNYQYAGVIHILSVSGLHVGFVLLFLNFFLNFLPNSNRFRVFKVLTLIVILWSFALVAGFSPSVVRSVTMFSFVAVGMYMRRKTYVFYTFFISILLILLFEPSFLFDVGFQLSYLALFFILWLQPTFEKVWQPKSRIMNHFWQVLTITFAAQLGTMPLSLYYFHQFPGLFFMANLMIMFLITVIMGVGLVLVLIAFWTVIPSFVAKILEKLIWLLNFIVEKIASFESFIFKDIPFNFWMMVSCFLLVISLGSLISKPNFKTTVFLLFAILLFQLSYFTFDFNSTNRNELLVFQVRNSSMLVERENKKLTVFSSASNKDSIKADRNIQSFNLANNTAVSAIKSIPSLMYFKDERILILDSLSVLLPELEPSIILIRQSPKINFDRFLKIYKPELVIVDASNYKNVVEQIRRSCQQHKILFHSVAEKGFYRID